MPLRILVDADIPLGPDAFARYGTVRALPGRAIDRGACRHADALIVRSVSRVDASTLDDTPVRFVGTATAGIDHVNVDYLARRAIPFAFAPGSNAESVIEWVIASLLAMAAGGRLDGKTVGVIGCGHVGGGLRARLEALGMIVLACDPPLADAAAAAGHPHDFVPYARTLEEADVLTFHTPLTFDGAYPTFHLLGIDELRSTRHGVWILNSSRGAVVDTAALEASVRSGHVTGAALDVWESEPTPASTLIEAVDIATPHIAGYSYDAKLAGAVMMEEALRAWLAAEGFALPPVFDWESAAGAVDRSGLPSGTSSSIIDAPPVDAPAWLDTVVRAAYDVRADDARFRDAMLDPSLDQAVRADAFTELRRRYPTRRSWRHYTIRGAIPSTLDLAVRRGLMMRAASEGAV